MALPEKIHLVIVTPERQLFSGLVDRVTVPSSQGYLGILPGHAPLLAELGIGNISYQVAGQTEQVFCSWGFADFLGREAGFFSAAAVDAVSAGV